MHSSRRRLHRRDRQSKDLVGSKSELVVVVVVVAALVVKVPVVVVEVVVASMSFGSGPWWQLVLPRRCSMTCGRTGLVPRRKQSNDNENSSLSMGACKTAAESSLANTARMAEW